MTLSPKLGVVEISTLWHFSILLLIQMFIKVASSPSLSGIGMSSPILWSHLLKMQRIVLLSSLLWWELGTNSLITGPGEWLSFRRFTSKLSWSWSWHVFHGPLTSDFSMVVIAVIGRFLNCTDGHKLIFYHRLYPCVTSRVCFHSTASCSGVGLEVNI